MSMLFTMFDLGLGISPKILEYYHHMIPAARLCVGIVLHFPVDELETLRKLGCYEFEDDDEEQIYSHNGVLSFAIKYNHVDYVQHLVTNFPDRIQKGFYFHKDMGCLWLAVNLGLAVTFNRRNILMYLLETIQLFPYWIRYVNEMAFTFPYKVKTALQYSCRYLCPSLILILLRNGAEKEVKKYKVQAPLDILLSKMWNSPKLRKVHFQCLDNLLTFPLPKNFEMKDNLKENSTAWVSALGEKKYNYLLGGTPTPLYFLAMRTVVQSLDPYTLAESIKKLPIPEHIKPMPDYAPNGRTKTPTVDEKKNPILLLQEL